MPYVPQIRRCVIGFGRGSCETRVAARAQTRNGGQEWQLVNVMSGCGVSMNASGTSFSLTLQDNEARFWRKIVSGTQNLSAVQIAGVSVVGLAVLGVMWE
jgi:hypothetical protein